MNHGWADYRDQHLSPALEQSNNYKHRKHAVESQIRRGVAWAAYRDDIAFDAPGGYLEIDGRGTAVLEKREGRWVIVHLHTSGRRRQPGQ